MLFTHCVYRKAAIGKAKEQISVSLTWRPVREEAMARMNESLKLNELKAFITLNEHNTNSAWELARQGYDFIALRVSHSNDGSQFQMKM